MHTASTSTPGLLLSLSAALPGASPLRRQAAHIARQLDRPHPRSLERKASDLLARLLDATDTPESAEYETDGVLDAQFDD